MLWLEETHGQQNKFCFDNLRLSFFHHYGAAAIGIRLPIYFLDFHASQFAILTHELQGVDVPTTDASFFVTRSGLEGAGPVRPGIQRVLRSFNRLGHDFDLGDGLAALAMSCADANGAGVPTTNNEYVFALGGDAFVLTKLFTREYAVLLGKQFQGEVNTF